MSADNIKYNTGLSWKKSENELVLFSRGGSLPYRIMLIWVLLSLVVLALYFTKSIYISALLLLFILFVCFYPKKIANFTKDGITIFKFWGLMPGETKQGSIEIKDEDFTMRMPNRWTGSIPTKQKETILKIVDQNSDILWSIKFYTSASKDDLQPLVRDVNDIIG